jgi:UDPglucose 6-dehydrogenase
VIRKSLLGWAFKKDTNDTRESAAIYVAEHPIEDQIHVYDPVTEAKNQSRHAVFMGIEWT